MFVNFGSSSLNLAQQKVRFMLNLAPQEVGSISCINTCFFFQFDAEIVFWEGKGREQQMQMEFMSQEIMNVGNTSKINSEQVYLISYAIKYFHIA